MVEQTNKEPAQPPPTPWPPVPSWMDTDSATNLAQMAFDAATGLPNPLMAEQVLAAELGKRKETPEEQKRISLTRLKELFCPVLSTTSIDENWTPARQLTAFFDTDDEYFVMTRSGSYAALVPKLKVLNSLLRSLFEKE